MAFWLTRPLPNSTHHMKYDTSDCCPATCIYPSIKYVPLSCMGTPPWGITLFHMSLFPLVQNNLTWHKVYIHFAKQSVITKQNHLPLDLIFPFNQSGYSPKICMGLVGGPSAPSIAFLCYIMQLWKYFAASLPILGRVRIASMCVTSSPVRVIQWYHFRSDWLRHHGAQPIFWISPVGSRLYRISSSGSFDIFLL